MKNVVLIGMPSCGKSTVGRIIAEKTGRKFIDTDLLVEADVGKRIPDIFAESGESYFREKEREAVDRAAEERGAVIACGGGVVLDVRNVNVLKKNGVIAFIRRDIGLLSTEGRPLSKNAAALKEMEKIRMPLYEKYADFTVDNDKQPVDTAEEIIRGINENHGN